MSLQLSKENYGQILKFATLLQKYNTDIEYHIFRLLDELFGYEYGAYMHYDKDKLIRGVFYNLPHQYELKNYKAHEEEDPLNEYIKSSDFYERINSDSEDKSVTIKDLMTYTDYEKTQHCKHLMDMNLYYQLTAYPIINSEKGDSIAVFRKKDEEEFTLKDKIILSYIANVISPILTEVKNSLHLKEKIEFFQSNNKILPFGLITFDENFEITDFNDLALNYYAAAIKSDEITHLDKSLIDNVFSVEDKATFSISENITIEQILNTYTFKLFPKNKITLSNETKKYYVLHIYKSKAIDTVDDINNIFGLTQRELEIVLLIMKGYKNKEITERLFISKSTTQTHLENTYRKVDVHSRTELIKKINECSI